MNFLVNRMPPYLCLVDQFVYISYIIQRHVHIHSTPFWKYQAYKTVHHASPEQ